MKISKLKEKIYEEYKRIGFEDYFNKGNLVLGDLAELGLVTTEISEGLECIRKGNKEHLGEELADIIIRTINFSTRKHIDIEMELRKKILINSKREYKHGNQNV